tara:strand:+ start:1247 stop:1504 length:258 start_codon:yes stop_codon:yes gene_type:complete
MIKYKLQDDIIIESIDDKFILLNLNTGKFLEMNQTGYRIFKSIEMQLSYDEIVKKFLKVYSVDTETAKQDIDNFIQQLKEKSIIY